MAEKVIRIDWLRVRGSHDVQGAVEDAACQQDGYPTAADFANRAQDLMPRLLTKESIPVVTKHPPLQNQGPPYVREYNREP